MIPSTESWSEALCIKFSLNPAEGFVERIARTAHGADRILFRLPRQCLAQPPDMNVDSALVDFRREPPNAVEQLRARKDPAGFPHQMVEQAELGRSHMHVTAGAADAPVLPIEVEIARRKLAARAIRPRPAQQGMNARHEFGKRERFD